MKPILRHGLVLLASTVVVGAAWIACAQLTRPGRGKDFMYPEYHPLTSGVARKKSVVRAEEYELVVSNNLAALWRARVEFYRPDGTNLEWTAIAREAIVDLNTREVSGTNKVFFRTADDRLFVTGEGFLWQQTNSMLILSSNTFTWIDIRTNAPGRTNKMKSLVAVSLVATARLTAAEMEIPPQRPGLIIKAGAQILSLKTNTWVLLTNNVFVTYPPARSTEATTYLSCAWATIRRGTNGEIDEIAAHGKVAVDRGDEHARGNYAVYTGTNEMLALVGAFDPEDTTRPLPYLYSPQGTNEGQAIIYDRRRNVLTTIESIVHVPAAMLKSFNSTNAASTNNARATNAADRPRAAPPSK